MTPTTRTATCPKCRWRKANIHPDRLAAAVHRHVSRCKGTAPR